MTDRDALLEMLSLRSVRRGRVTLASGRESDFFVDCKQTALTAKGHVLVGRVLWSALQALPEMPRAVAGVALGGCSLASAVSLVSHLEGGVELDALYVRKAAKDHGSRREIEGDDHLPAGAPVVMLEDVITTGGSTLDALTRIRARDLRPVGVIVLVDREEGGREAIERAGTPVISVFRRSDFA